MGTSLTRNSPPPLGPPQDPRPIATVWSWGGAVSYERGTPVPHTLHEDEGIVSQPD